MTAIPARRRRRMAIAITTSVLTMIALPSGVVIGAQQLLNGSGGNNVADSGATITIPNTPTAMLGVTNSRNELVSLSLVALTPEGKGGTIVSVPVGSAADVAKGEAPRRIADSYTTGGVAALRTDVENLLNVSIDVFEVMNAGQLGTAIAGIGSQPVSLAAAVNDTGADGKPLVVVPAGSSTLPAAQIATALASSDSSVAESVRLPQVKALWAAVARGGVALAAPTTDSTVPAESEGEPTTVSEFITNLLAGSVDVWQFTPTLLTDAVHNPSNADMYSLDGGEVLMVMASVSPSCLRLMNDALSVMLDVPFGNTTYAQQAVTRLAFMGANVVLVRETADTPTEKTVGYYDVTAVRDEASSYADLLGAIDFRPATETVEGVNLRLVLGNDFLAFLAAADEPTTTVPE